VPGQSETERAALTEAPDLLDALPIGGTSPARPSVRSKRRAATGTGTWGSSENSPNDEESASDVNLTKKPRTTQEQTETTTSSGRRRVQPSILEEKPWSENFSNLGDVDDDLDVTMVLQPRRGTPRQARSADAASDSTTRRPTLSSTRLQLEPADPALQSVAVQPRGDNVTRGWAVCDLV